MATIRTILGDIAPETLGHCQCHEHLFLENGKSFEITPVLRMEDYEKSKEELLLYRRAGGEALVDAQPVGCGRMAELLIRVAEETETHILASTGFHKTIFYYEDSFIFSWDEKQLIDLWREEICEGMYSSDVDGKKPLSARAGILKTAVDSQGIRKDRQYQKLFEAAAETAKMTGVPIVCHIEQGADAFEVVRFFADRGIGAKQLILCHVDRARYDFGYHRELLQCGIYLEYDTIAREKYHSDDKEADLFLAMVDFEEQLLFGLDTTNARLKSYGGKTGLDYILKEFLPYLEKRGIPETMKFKLTVENPRRALTIKQKEGEM